MPLAYVAVTREYIHEEVEGRMSHFIIQKFFFFFFFFFFFL